MITPIHLEVNLDSGVAGALRRLGCTDRAAIARDIWFAEPFPVSPGAPTLLSSHIVIRLRSDAADDLTVVLRPCERSRLTGRWAAPFTDVAVRYRIATVWRAEERALSAAVISRRPPGSLREIVARGTDITAALDPAQRQFLVSCTPPGVSVQHLRALGPVVSALWRTIPVGTVSADIERWTVAGLDLLELSLTVLPVQGDSSEDLYRRAIAAQRGLENGLRRLRLRPAVGKTNTERVLRALTVTGSAPGA